MQLKQLEHFLAVGDTGTFAAAARSLNLSQQALSYSIAKLEKDCGVRLFERTNGNATARLTAFGTSLIRYARRIRIEVDRAETELRLLQDAASGEVRVGIGLALSGGLAPRAIQAFRRQHPNVKLIIEEGSTAAMIQQLSAGELDMVAGALLIDAELGPELDVIPLGETEDRVIARANHPLSQLDIVTVADLVPYPWMIETRLEGDYTLIAEAFMKAGLPPPRDIVWLNAITTGRSLLMTDDYLALGPIDMNLMMLDAGLLLAMEVEGLSRTRSWCLAHHREHPLSPAGLALASEFQRTRLIS